jgi:succinyl-diaminopimelate desuccinylase
MSSPTLELAQKLISRRSLTPDDDNCQRIISARLNALKFKTESLRFGDVDNLWARLGTLSPLICFAGHTDVVPTGPLDQWHSDPFLPSVRNNMLYGRGTSDMKGPLAAFLTAIEVFVRDYADFNGSIAVLVTSDEEGVAVDGTAKVVDMLKARGEHIDYCIVAEPTSEKKLCDTVKNGRRGSLSATLVVHGKQGHIAYPHLAENAIHLVAPALAELAQVEWDNGNEDFPPTSWQVSNIHAGTGATNVIPGRAEVTFNFRFSTASSVDALKAKVHQILDRHKLGYDLDWTLSGKPYLTQRGNLVDAVGDAVHQIVGYRPRLSTSGGTSDGRFIVDICPQIVEVGPSNATIHQIDECISIDDLNRLSEIYTGILRNLLIDHHT